MPHPSPTRHRRGRIGVLLLILALLFGGILVSLRTAIQAGGIPGPEITVTLGPMGLVGGTTTYPNCHPLFTCEAAIDPPAGPQPEYYVLWWTFSLGNHMQGGQLIRRPVPPTSRP
ncbi:MAG: hypothetical protein HC828_03530 [Blastochloris sp.]|nr:hypothetical protein [Blastochloris sp.]